MMNCAFGRLIALSMRSVHQVAVRLNPPRPRGDHTPPAVLDFPVVGCRLGLPPVVDCTTTLSPPRRGSLTGSALLEKGAPRLKSVGGLNAVPEVARRNTVAAGRISIPACHV